MFMKIKVVLFALTISILLAGCSPQIPDIGVSSKFLNHYLEIRTVPDFNEFKFNESIVLDVMAQTDVEVKVNFGDTRIFMFDGEVNDWREIKDKGFSGTGIFRDIDLFPEYSSKPPDILLSTTCVSIQCKPVETFGIDPDIPNDGKPVDILVVVVGNIYENGIMTDKKTGAYVIFTLKP